MSKIQPSSRNCTLNQINILLPLFFCAFILLFSNRSYTQPYLDIINLKYTQGLHNGLIAPDKKEVDLRYFAVATNLPLVLKNKKDALIFSPFFEYWASKIQDEKRQNYYSLALPVSLSKSIPNSHWNVLLTGIVRMNDSSIQQKGKIQLGGALITAYQKNKRLTWKLGIYINNELFGLFVMPLIGIDWRINERNNLFGVLPDNLTYEHKLNKHFYYGANFRAITNSFSKTSGYWRIDENQLGIYLDTYLNKNFVLNLEAGHSILRKIKIRGKNTSIYDANVNNGLYLKLSFAYRLRSTR